MISMIMTGVCSFFDKHSRITIFLGMILLILSSYFNISKSLEIYNLRNYQIELKSTINQLNAEINLYQTHVKKLVDDYENDKQIWKDERERILVDYESKIDDISTRWDVDSERNCEDASKELKRNFISNRKSLSW